MEIQDMTLEQLIELQNNMKKKSEELYDSLCECTFDERDKSNKLEQELESLSRKMLEIEKLIMLKKEPITASEKIDLRKASGKLEGSYIVFLHNTSTDIGYIKYKGYHQFGGDMSYFIDEEYRGNGYVSEALKLLGDLLQKNGIGDFWLAIQKWNIPSIKTAEKYGGHVVSDFGHDALLYECKTLRNDLDEDKVIK